MGMRPSIGIPAMSNRSKRVLITLGVLAALAVLWFQFVGLFVDYLWYGEIGFRQVFTTQAASRVMLFLAAGLLSGGLVLTALILAYRSRPVFVPTAAELDPLAPYRTIITARPKLFAIGISAVVAFICGVSAQGQWATVQLWLNGGDFGTVDPEFGNDIGFYVFTLPMIQLVLGWLFVVIGLCFAAVLVTQYLFGGIRLSGPGRKITSQATLQLSVLIGLFVLVKAVQYWFDRYALLFSGRSGIFTGASYTDVNAVLPAKIILLCIAAICAIGFFVGAFMRSVKLPAIALALLVLSSVLIGGVWPLVLQQVVVRPNAITREHDYIERNIAATREAFGVGDDKVEYVEYVDKQTGDPRDLARDADLPNARLLDPNLLSDTFTQRQQLRNFYGFAKQLSVDRYTIDGETQDYVVAARELNVNGLSDSQKSWINEHLVYTHGNGFVAAPANKLVDGYPSFTVSDVQNQGLIPVAQPRVYYSKLATNYAIVGAPEGSSPREYDTDTANYTYTGKGGVNVGNLFQRLVFATEYGDANFLFSSEINGASKIMYHRDPRERVTKAAPFLTPDTRPYPAVVDGRMVWIVDAYTTAQNYPYAQTVTLSDATSNSLSAARGATGQVNAQVSYMRNSVKATVDAYDGTVKLYEVDEADPVLNAWQGVFPGLISPGSEISSDLRSHFRYPEDLFEVQRSMLTRYYVSNATEFYQGSNFWKVPKDPTESQVSAAQPPYYLQISLPGSTEKPKFELTSALTWFEREFISAYISADSDPENYGKITVLKLPTDTLTPGPVLIQQLFNSNTDISNYVTTRTTSGKSQVLYGNLLTLPTDQGLLYVEPLYLRGVSSNSYPQLGQVLVWYSGRVGMGPTLAQALENAAQNAPVTPPVSGGNGTPPATVSGGVPGPTTSQPPSSSMVLPPNAEAAVAEMDAALQELDRAKTSGDLAQIGAATQKLERAVANYLALTGENGGGSGTPAGTTPAVTTGTSPGG